MQHTHKKLLKTYFFHTLCVCFTIFLLATMPACGGGSGSDSNGNNIDNSDTSDQTSDDTTGDTSDDGSDSGDQGNSNVSGTTSNICDAINGLTAVYWDFSNGIPRGDLPNTANTIPTNFTVTFAHPTILSFFFWHPAEWVAQNVYAQPAGTYGVDLVRNDNKAVWRHLTTSVNGNVAVGDLLNQEVNTMLSFIGNPANPETVCEFSGAEPNFAGGTTSVASVLIRAGGFTANVNTKITSVPLGGGTFLSQASVYLVVTPSDEYEQNVRDVFVPIITQFYGGSSATKPACSDGDDNDADGKTDFPNDPECSSADDESEATL